MEPHVGNVLVTGATGFIGHHLVRRLAHSGARVHWMSRSEYGEAARSGQTVKGTFSSPETVVDIVKRINPARVFHLATHFVGVHKPSDLKPLVEANILFGAAVAEGAAHSHARFVYVESAWQRFEGKRSSVSLYAALKNAFEDVLDYFHEINDLEVSKVFLFDSYGPLDKRGKIVSSLIAATRQGKQVVLGSPDKLINLTHVFDVVSGLVDVSVMSPRTDWVVRPWSPVTLQHLVCEIESVSGSTLNVVWQPALDRPREMRSDWIFGEPVYIENPIPLQEGIRSEWRREAT